MAEFEQNVREAFRKYHAGELTIGKLLDVIEEEVRFVRQHIVTVPTFQLLQWKYAISLEAQGMKHSSGRSARKHACRMLGLKPLTPHGEVIERINTILEARR